MSLTTLRRSRPLTLHCNDDPPLDVLSHDEIGTSIALYRGNGRQRDLPAVGGLNLRRPDGIQIRRDVHRVPHDEREGNLPLEDLADRVPEAGRLQRVHYRPGLQTLTGGSA